MNKILGHKSYGSIPHLSISKLTQQADKKISIGQEQILTKKIRDYKDLIIVQEKVDGCNVAVYKKDNKLFALTRAGYEAQTSKYKQHLLFYEFVKNNKDRFLNLLDENERICGEWILQTHGIKYKLLHEPFVVFDIMKSHERLNYISFLKRVNTIFIIANLIHIGAPVKVDKALKIMGKGKHGAEKPEGLVYRCERENKVDFLAKYVRNDKIDGEYMELEIFNENYERYINNE